MEKKVTFFSRDYVKSYDNGTRIIYIKLTTLYSIPKCKSHGLMLCNWVME